MPTPAKKPANKKPAATAEAPAKKAAPTVGDLVEYRFDDVPTSSVVTVRGVVTDITDDGAYVAPLESAAVVPLDQLRAL